LLKFSIQYINNVPEIYYEISSRYSMQDMFIKRKMMSPDIRSVIMGLERIIESCKEYLLDINSIVLKPEMIFFSREENMPEFCYCPNNDGDFMDSIREMLQYILTVINNSDRDTVIMAYGLQQICLKENFTITELVDFAVAGIQEKREEIEQDLQDYTDEESCSDYNLRKCENVAKNKNISDSQNIPIIEALKNLFKKKKIISNCNYNKYKTEMDFSKQYNKVAENNNYNVNMEADAASISYYKLKEPNNEDETQLLTIKDASCGLYLKSIDKRNYKDIVPNTYPYVIGKFQKNVDFIIDNKMISRMHAKFTEESEGYFMEDLNSTNGTYLNDRRLAPHEKVPVRIGDKVTFSTISYIVE
ncbi:MAG: DUF6382 domain-containing protein, partial [Eubacterium sp.]